MKIGVCAKIAPDADARLKVAGGGSGIDLDGVKLGISDYDEYAIEEAIRTQEKHGGSIVSFTVGAAGDDKLLRSGALALGVEKAVLITESASDPLAIAKLLAAAIQKEGGVDVVFTGKSTIDAQNFQVGTMLAELLGWVHVTQVTALEFEGTSFKATRNLDAGVRQVVQGSLPAVISCEDGLNTVRYAKLPAIMKAKTKPLETVTASALGVDAGSRSSVGGMAPPPARPAGRILTGDAATVAKDLVRILRDEAKVL